MRLEEDESCRSKAENCAVQFDVCEDFMFGCVDDLGSRLTISKGYGGSGVSNIVGLLLRVLARYQGKVFLALSERSAVPGKQNTSTGYSSHQVENQCPGSYDMSQWYCTMRTAHSCCRV